MYYQLGWRVDNSVYSNTDDRPRTRVPWTMGVMYNGEQPPQPLVCNLDPKCGDTLRDVYLSDLPLFSNRMIEVLENNGVSNLQLFEGGVRTPKGVEHLNYKAVNIVGLISCANMEASQYSAGSEPPLMNFQNLVIDESRIGGHDIFRLHESSLCILVSEKLKEAIEEAGLQGFTLDPVPSQNS